MKQSYFFLSFLHPVFATLAFESPLLFVWCLKHPAQLPDALIVRLVKKNQSVSDKSSKKYFPVVVTESRENKKLKESCR